MGIEEQGLFCCWLCRGGLSRSCKESKWNNVFPATINKK